MADENRISVGEERVEKRKVDDFAALYNLDATNSSRTLTESTGRSLIHTKFNLLPRIIHFIN